MNNKPGIGAHSPHPFDIHVGKRLNSRRQECGFTQDSLGEFVGVTRHQIKNYENARNRISASMLWELSRALDFPIQYFVEGFKVNPHQNNSQTPETPPSSWTQLYFEFKSLKPWQQDSIRHLLSVQKKISRINDQNENRVSSNKSTI